MKSRNMGVKGFTMVEMMIVVGIIGLLATIAVPNWVRARTRSQKTACINNLRQIDAAAQTWALDNKVGPSATVVFSNISGYLKGAVICPAGGTAFSDSYSITTVSAKPTCQKDSVNHVLAPDTSS